MTIGRAQWNGIPWFHYTPLPSSLTILDSWRGSRWGCPLCPAEDLRSRHAFLQHQLAFLHLLSSDRSSRLETPRRTRRRHSHHHSPPLWRGSLSGGLYPSSLKQSTNDGGILAGAACRRGATGKWNLSRIVDAITPVLPYLQPVHREWGNVDVAYVSEALASPSFELYTVEFSVLISVANTVRAWVSWALS